MLRARGIATVRNKTRTSLVVQGLKTLCCQCRGLLLTPGQRPRSHTSQLRVHMLQLKIPPATTKTGGLVCCKKDPGQKKKKRTKQMVPVLKEHRLVGKLGETGSSRHPARACGRASTRHSVESSEGVQRRELS